MARPAISGLKHSGALSLLRMQAPLGPPLTALTEALAAEQINLAFLLGQVATAAVPGLCLCLEAGNGPRALELARTIADEYGLNPPDLTPEVVAVTFYPLGRDLTLPAAALACLSRRGIDALAFGTSLSAVVVVVQAVDLEEALEHLRREFDLPGAASPAEERVPVVQAPTRRGEV
jgi:hypothetical protein